MWQDNGRIAAAEKLITEGKYKASLRETREVLNSEPRTIGDAALFQIGLIYASPGNPDRDYEKSIQFFQRVIEEFPRSRISNQAEIWILFVQEIMNKEKKLSELEEKRGDLDTALDKEREKVEELRRQLLRLKEIDLEIAGKRNRAEIERYGENRGILAPYKQP